MKFILGVKSILILANNIVFIFSFQSTNFANPIYEQYYTHKDSRQELLKAEDSDDDEDISKNKV